MCAVVLEDTEEYQTSAVPVDVGSRISKQIIVATCQQAKLNLFCKSSSSQIYPKCFNPEGTTFETARNAKCPTDTKWTDTECHSLGHIFVYNAEDDSTEGVLAEHNGETDAWNYTSNRDIYVSGVKGKIHFAVCISIKPRNTTTSTTTPLISTSGFSMETEAHLERRDCYPGSLTTTDSGSPTIGTTPSLPDIDLFLNPSRTQELLDMKAWLQERHNNNRFTKVE